uniref:RING-type domain-containing protein n=1 Tax=Rhizophora mucronata TaxID=61149 RepID=A0A2P2JST2_RHIMU
MVKSLILRGNTASRIFSSWKNIYWQNWFVFSEKLDLFFSTGDAMWWLLICDMNVSHACATNGDPLSGFAPDSSSNGTSSISTQPQLKTEVKCSELNLLDHSKSIPSLACSCSSPSGTPSMAKPKNSAILGGAVSENEGLISTFNPVENSFSVAGTSHSPVVEDKFVVSKKVHFGSNRRENILRQKSLHLEKSYRTYGSKGSSRSGKLSGLVSLISDKKLKSVSDSTVNIKNAAIRLSKAMAVDASQDNGNQNLLRNPRPSSLASINLETSNTVSSVPETNIPSTLPQINALPALLAASNPLALPVANTELSLSLPTKVTSSSTAVGCNAEALDCGYTRGTYDKSHSQVFHDKKDEMIVKLLPRVHELENQLQEWTEWANQKVMQAARRLSKDKAELKSLRQETEEVERLKKEKRVLEENTMKKLTEMENALAKASGQVERANSAVRRLEVEKAALRQEMDAAKLRATESAASCQEVLKREKTTLLKYQSWEKQKALLQEELVTEKRKAAQLVKDLEQAEHLQEQHEARLQQENKAKDELIMRGNSIKKEREQIETLAKSKEDTIKLKAETNLQKYNDDIQKLEMEISQLRLKMDSSKIAALRRGIDGSYASRLADAKNSLVQKESHPSSMSEVVKAFHDYTETGVKRERECVMCLSEEMSVVFLPCTHQVVCTTCNELHEKQGMKECPSCRSPIQRRIPVRYAHS